MKKAIVDGKIVVPTGTVEEVVAALFALIGARSKVAGTVRAYCLKMLKENGVSESDAILPEHEELRVKIQQMVYQQIKGGMTIEAMKEAKETDARWNVYLAAKTAFSRYWESLKPTVETTETDDLAGVEIVEGEEPVDVDAAWLKLLKAFDTAARHYCKTVEGDDYTPEMVKATIKTAALALQKELPSAK